MVGKVTLMKARRARSLSRREAQLMEILWDTGGTTATEVRQRLADDSAESTIRTLLTILVRKGYVRRTRRSHPYRYVPKIPRDELAKPALRQLLDRFFGGSAPALVIRMLDSGELTPEDLNTLARRFRRP